jgi:hypothetical protein
VLCCASLRLRLRTLCAGSRSEALVGFVAEKLSQVLGDLQINLFGNEPLNLFGTELLYHGEDIFCCAAQVCESGSVHCEPVAEVRRLLDL